MTNRLEFNAWSEDEFEALMDYFEVDCMLEDYDFTVESDGQVSGFFDFTPESEMTADALLNLRELWHVDQRLLELSELWRNDGSEDGDDEDEKGRIMEEFYIEFTPEGFYDDGDDDDLL